MQIAVHVQNPAASSRAGRGVEYRWDADTEILSAHLAPGGAEQATGAGSIGVEGSDGSWLILDVAAGTISGVEVAVWPEIVTRPSLAPPANVEDADVRLGAFGPSGAPGAAAALEVRTPLLAECDGEQRTIHFRLGRAAGRARTIRLGGDLLLDVDEKSQIAGLWLLNVPPCPNES